MTDGMRKTAVKDLIVAGKGRILGRKEIWLSMVTFYIPICASHINSYFTLMLSDLWNSS